MVMMPHNCVRNLIACSRRGNRVHHLSHPDRSCLWSLRTLGYSDKDALALVQTRDPRPVERGDVYEDVLPAAVPNNETEPLGDVVPLHRPHLLGAGLQGLSV